MTRNSIFYTVVLLAVFYNSLLAMINAHLFHVNLSLTVLSEVMIVGAALFLSLEAGFRQIEKWFLWGLILFSTLAIYLTLLNGRVVVDGLRNFLIMFVFFSIGARLRLDMVIKIFFLITCLVLFFLVLEILFLNVYVTIFQPALYYAATRGQEVSQFNEVGLFNNALGFASRFSFGLFDVPRTSSVFLEQVSLANFATVLTIFCVTFYNVLKKKHLIVFIFTILLILTTNNTRTASILFLIIGLGYFVFPLLPRYFNVLYPLLILAVAIPIYIYSPDQKGDDLVGRINISMGHFINLSFSDYIGYAANNLYRLYDSGYAYIVGANTLIGAIYIWLLISLILRQEYPFTKRCAYAVGLYFFVNLLIGGTAVYSMKVASLLWLIIGAAYVVQNGAQRDAR